MSVSLSTLLSFHRLSEAVTLAIQLGVDPTVVSPAAIRAQTEHSCHQGQTESPTFRKMGKRRRAEGQIEGWGTNDDLESTVIS
jgi:hypothetical protein